MDCTIPCVCDSVFGQDRLRTCVHSSTKWPPTEVMDAKAMGLTLDPFALNKPSSSV